MAVLPLAAALMIGCRPLELLGGDVDLPLPVTYEQATLTVEWDGGSPAVHDVGVRLVLFDLSPKPENCFWVGWLSMVSQQPGSSVLIGSLPVPVGLGLGDLAQMTLGPDSMSVGGPGSGSGYTLVIGKTTIPEMGAATVLLTEDALLLSTADAVVCDAGSCVAGVSVDVRVETSWSWPVDVSDEPVYYDARCYAARPVDGASTSDGRSLCWVLEESAECDGRDEEP